MKMDNCAYNKIKLLHDMSTLDIFIETETFGKKDAKMSRHGQCHTVLDHLHKDLSAHMEQLRNQLAHQKM